MAESTDKPLAALAESLSAGSLGTAALVLVLTWLASKLVGVLVRRLGEYLPNRRLLLNRIAPVVRFAMWTAAFYVSIAVVLQPPRETLLALGASAGLALGLASQDLVKNMISGLLILFEQPYQVGDIVEIEGVEGEVVSIGLRATRLRTFGDSIVTLPNGKLFESAISNANSGALRQQVSVDFRLPAHIDSATVKSLAREAAETSPYVWLGGPISVLVESEFDRTFLTRFSLRAYVVDIRLQRVFRSELIERMHRESLRRGWLDDELVLSALGVTAKGQPPAPAPVG